MGNLPQNLWKGKCSFGTATFSFTGAASSAGAARARALRLRDVAATSGEPGRYDTCCSNVWRAPRSWNAGAGRRRVLARVSCEKHGFDVVSYATAHSQEWLGELSS